jgi:outer membrane protein assembly factor BamB
MAHLGGRQWAIGLAVAGLLASTALAGDWPMWGGTPSRNMVSDEKNLPAPVPAAGATGGLPASASSPTVTAAEKGKAPRDKAPAAQEPRGIKWQLKLGSNTAGTPVVVGGRIYLGTNEGAYTQPGLKTPGGGGQILCINEATGKVIWQLVCPRMRTQAKGFNFDQLGFGVCSSPFVDGKNIYFTSNRDEVLCLDTMGQTDGNAGPYLTEGRYQPGPGDLPNKPGRFDPLKETTKAPAEVPIGPTDGDILWIFDMLGQPIDSWPQDAACSSPLVVDDFVYAGTANGVDSSHKNHPSPKAPDLVCLDKKTGALLGVNESPIGEEVFHGGWSSPALATVAGRNLIVFGGGDGFCYAYDAKPTPAAEPGKPGVLKKVWWFDANTPGSRAKGYHSREGCSEIDGTPVIYKNRVYVTVGQDTEHGPGHGCLSCIDATKTGDLSTTGKVWQYGGLDRSMCTPAVANDLVYASDFSGVLHCLDANTGKVLWTHKLPDHTISSPLVADGKVYQGDDSGNVTVMAAGPEEKLLGVVKFGAPIHASLVAANGVLYVTTRTTLFAWRSLSAPGAAATPAPTSTK